MPRIPRKLSSNGVYHVMLRGINKQTIFEDDQDKHRFLDTIKRYKNASRFEVYSYCLMDNHIHLLIKEIEEPVSSVIQRISSSYVHWYNNKYDRCGHLFQERFKSENVETTTYFLTVLRYIHQNPVKARLATNVFESKWTSIHEYINKASLVDVEYGLNLFSKDRGRAIFLFIMYMQEPNDDECLDENIRVKISDHEVIIYLHELGITNISALQQMKKETRDNVIKNLRELNGVSVRQLSRVTGISKSVIDRVR